MISLAFLKSFIASFHYCFNISFSIYLHSFVIFNPLSFFFFPTYCHIIIVIVLPLVVFIASFHNFVIHLVLYPFSLLFSLHVDNIVIALSSQLSVSHNIIILFFYHPGFSDFSFMLYYITVIFLDIFTNLSSVSQSSAILS